MAELCGMCEKYRSRKVNKVRLNGSLKNGIEVWVCPNCDVVDTTEKKGMTIVDLSWRKV